MLDDEKLVLRKIYGSDITTKFSLGNSAHTPLKTFLQKDALDFHRIEIAKTYVLVVENPFPSRIWGYVTLMNSEVILNEEERPRESLAASKYATFPAIKIARLAVDKSKRRKRYGQKLLDFSIDLVKFTIMPHVGCRFLIVDAKRDSIDFYQKSGFILLNTDSNQMDEHPLMFFDLYKNS